MFVFCSNLTRAIIGSFLGCTILKIYLNDVLYAHYIADNRLWELFIGLKTRLKIFISSYLHGMLVEVLQLENLVKLRLLDRILC